MKYKKQLLSPLLIPTIVAIFLLFAFLNNANADEQKHRLVIQVSTDDKRTQTIAMK